MTRRWPTLLLLPLLACHAIDEPGDLGEATDPLFLRHPSVLWPMNVVPVCWILPLGSTQDLEGRALVRTTIDNTWGRFAPLTFTGWGTCTPGQRGIHIRIADERPRSPVGFLDQGGGVNREMTLNFRLESWGWWYASDRNRAIRKHAIHEFGHALGFNHEQNRLDNTTCDESVEPNPNGFYLTAYDPDSIMNYCGFGGFPGTPALSRPDIEGVQKIYGWTSLFSNFGGTVPTSTAVASVSRIRNLVEVFRVGSDGRVYASSGWHGSVGATPWQSIGARANFVYGGAIAAVSRSTTTIDLYTIAADGGLYRTWRDFATGDWREWTRLGTGVAVPGADVTALVRGDNLVDLFVVGQNRLIYTFASRFGGTPTVCVPRPCTLPPPPDWTAVAGGATWHGSIAAVAPAPYHVILLAKGMDGQAYWTQRYDGGAFSGWAQLPGAASSAYSPVVAASRPGKVDAFYVDPSGLPQQARWTGHGGWAPFAAMAQAPLLGLGRLTAVARDPSTVDLFGVTSEGFLYTTSDDAPGGAWRQWYGLHDSVRLGANGIVTPLSHAEGVLRNGEFAYLTLDGWRSSGVVSFMSDHLALGSFGHTPGFPTQAWISQLVKIPRHSPRLHVGLFSNANGTNDWFGIEVRDPSGSFLGWALPPANAPADSADLAPWAGQTVELRFVHQDDGTPGTGSVQIIDDLHISFLNNPTDVTRTVDPTVQMDLFSVDVNGNIVNSSWDHL